MTTRASRDGATLLLAAVTCSALGCAPQVPVPRYPWFEDHSLALDAEVIRVRVKAEVVSVTARFQFRSVATVRDRVLTFPIPPPCADAEGFGAALVGPERPAQALATWPSSLDRLPAGEARQAFDIEIPGAALEAHGGFLQVSYAQSCVDAFRFSLASSAYWLGPIGQLDVQVDDPGGRVRNARVESEPAHVVHGTSSRWTFLELEPSAGLELELSPAPAVVPEPSSPSSAPAATEGGSS